jgi:hypothetical protein
VLSICVLLIICLPLIDDIIFRVFKDGFSSNGRIKIWKMGFDIWKKHIFFGPGICSKMMILNTPLGYQEVPLVFHSSIVEVLVVGGVVGIVFFIIHLYEKYRSLFKMDRLFIVTSVIGYVVVDLYGLIDKNGNTLLPCEFTYLDYNYPKYVIVSKTCDDPIWERKPEFGMIDYNNNWIIEPKYNYILPITDNIVALWIVKENSEYWALYNISTKEFKKIDSNYTLIDNINLFNKNNTEDFLSFYDFNTEKYGLINSNGDIILNSICSKIEPNPDNGYWQVLIDNRWMLFKAEEGIINSEEYLDFSKIK